MVEFSYLASAIISVLTVVVAGFYLLLGVDDVVFDVMFWMREIRRAVSGRNWPRLTLEKLRAKPEQRVAIMIPCWHEYAVVERMLEFAANNIEYQHYDIFVGVYPNDEQTVTNARAVAERFTQIKVVVNPLPGPTTKAQNLNAIFAEIERTEGDDPYEIMVLHDTEDVIHPLSLKMYNYLMPQRQMIQLPVLPLERPPFEWTSWTYADEFAENHQKDMIIREAIGSFVPSAGVGCAFSRPALEIMSVTAEDIFPAKTLTEDYQLGLRLRLRGLSTIFVSQQIALRQSQKYATAASYIATRAYFPDRLSTAVRQKSRWVVGICFEAWQSTGWVGNLATRYALYRDRKSVAANVFALFGYAVLLAGAIMLVWHTIDSRIVAPNVPNHRIVWALLDAVLLMTLWRLTQKAYFVAALYGPMQGMLAVVRPPWGALINGLATLRAIAQFSLALQEQRAVVWSKTDHVFPSDAVLGEFRRQLGRVLLDSNKIDEAGLSQALDLKEPNERLGDTLVRLGMVSERDVINAIAEQSGATSAVDNDLVPSEEALARLPFDVAQDNSWLPLAIRGDVLELAVNSLPTRRELDMISREAHLRVEPHLVELRRLSAAIARAYRFGSDVRGKPIGVFLVEAHAIDRATLDRYLATPDPAGRRLVERMADDGVLDEVALERVARAYFDVAVQREGGELTLPSPEMLREADDLLRAHPSLSLVRVGGTLTLMAPVAIDSGVIGVAHQRFGNVVAVVASLTRARAARALIDGERERLTEPR